MGKNSLIKKTDKKKASSEKAEEEKKVKGTKKAKTPAKKSASPKKAAASKKAETPKKKTTKAKPKATTKTKTAAKAKKTAKTPAKKTKKAPAKKVSLKELVLKRFDSWKPEKPFKPESAIHDYTAPPFVSGADKTEIRRIKTLLLKKFSMADIAAAAEKAAAEKAAAEKGAAKKVAAEKDKVEKVATEKVSVTYEKQDDSAVYSDTADKTARYAITGLAAGVALIFLMIILASASNTGNYYLKPTDNGLEIWQGKFAPLGEKMVLSLPGVEVPGSIKQVYTKQEVFPIAFNYYIDKADDLLKVSSTPDFEKIKFYLNSAMAYAATAELRKIARARLNGIDLMILMYKANVTASRGTVEDLDEALDLLDQAALLAADDSQAQLIEDKISAIEKQKTALEAEAAASESAPPAE